MDFRKISDAIYSRWGAILFIGGGTALFMILVLWVAKPGSSGDTAKTLNTICAPHNGVSRIDYPFVICRDGFASKY